ncbi:hypothetical protein J6590_066982 [Homalodisca vitripennis]|nr:hypothetical protein J6590_066982 [Homalodisca vitripennis]
MDTFPNGEFSAWHYINGRKGSAVPRGKIAQKGGSYRGSKSIHKAAALKNNVPSIKGAVLKAKAFADYGVKIKKMVYCLVLVEFQLSHKRGRTSSRTHSLESF